MFFSFSLLLLLWDPRRDSRADGATTAPTFPLRLPPSSTPPVEEVIHPVAGVRHCATPPSRHAARHGNSRLLEVASVSSSTLSDDTPFMSQPRLTLSAPLTALTHTLFRDGVSVVFIAHSHKHWHRRQNADGDFVDGTNPVVMATVKASQQTAGDWGKALRRPLLATARFSWMAQKGTKVLFYLSFSICFNQKCLISFTYSSFIFANGQKKKKVNFQKLLKTFFNKKKKAITLTLQWQNDDGNNQTLFHHCELEVKLLLKKKKKTRFVRADCSAAFHMMQLSSGWLSGSAIQLGVFTICCHHPVQLCRNVLTLFS